MNTVAGRPNGWFVDTDDESALAATLIEVVNNAPERRAHGQTAYEQIRAGYAWDTIATRVVSLHEGPLANTAPGKTGHVAGGPSREARETASKKMQ